MAIVHAVACDHPTAAPPATRYGMQDRHLCPAISRPAATHVVLRTVAARDGWVIDGDRHLCPAHALEATP